VEGAVLVGNNGVQPFTSMPLDAGLGATWNKVYVPKDDLPPSVNLVVEVRTGMPDTSQPGGIAWSNFVPISHGNAVPKVNGLNARYLQFLVTLNNPAAKPLPSVNPFRIDVTSAAKAEGHEHFKTDQVSSLPTVDAPVLAGASGVSPTDPVTSTGVFDASSGETWKSVSWTTAANLPSDAEVIVEVSTGNSSTPDQTWSEWSAVANGGVIESPGRYLKYRVRVLTANSSLTTTPISISLTANTDGVASTPFPGSDLGNRSLEATA
jgi:hypothetical protein